MGAGAESIVHHETLQVRFQGHCPPDVVDHRAPLDPDEHAPHAPRHHRHSGGGGVGGGVGVGGGGIVRQVALLPHVELAHLADDVAAVVGVDEPVGGRVGVVVGVGVGVGVKAPLLVFVAAAAVDVDGARGERSDLV